MTIVTELSYARASSDSYKYLLCDENSLFSPLLSGPGCRARRDGSRADKQIKALRQSYKEKFKDDPYEAAERQERAAERRLAAAKGSSLNFSL